MNKGLECVLNDAIDAYNELVSENEYLWWWDVLNGMKDLTDDEEVIRVIMQIERATKKRQMKKVAAF